MILAGKGKMGLHQKSELGPCHRYAMRDFPGGSLVKNAPAKAGDSRDVGSIPELGRSPGVGTSNPLQYFCLENPMDGAAWGPWGPGVHGPLESMGSQRVGRN